jgi:AraC-like DNA-binding protein
MTASATPPCVRVSTEALAPRDQLPAWDAWFEPVFSVDHSVADALDFPAEAVFWSLGTVGLSRVRAPRLRAIREQRHIRREPTDHWSITFGGQETRLTLPHGRILVPANRPFVTSLADPVSSERAADERFTLFLARDRFTALAPDLARLRGGWIEGGPAHLLMDFLRLLERSLPGLSEHERALLPQAIAGMVAACAAPSAARAAAAAPQIDIARLERVRQVVRRRIGSAMLTTAAICREVGISRSQLYRLLESEGGVMRFVQRMRLRAAEAALSDPLDQRGVAAIGEAHGFHDPSSFSRAFRREFGVAPMELRAAALSGGGRRPSLRPLLRAESASLRDALRAL